MQKKIKRFASKALILLIILQALSVFIPISNATEYIIDGDKVYIDDEYVYLSAEPHTIMESDDVVFELISKQFSGEVDVAFGINNTLMSVSNPRLWNGSAWNPLNKEIQVVNQVHQNYNKWFLLKNVDVVEDVLYRLKISVDVVFNTSGKYFFGVKRSIDPISAGYYLDPWWSSDWENYRTLTISNTYIDNDLVNFTTLVTINSTIASKCQSNGEDIRFVDLDNTTQYKHEIEFWNASGNSSVWVKVPRVESGVDTTFLMYYNNSIAIDDQNQSGTWDSNHVGVWHLTESSSTYNDSTSYFNNGTGTSMNNNVSGQIASCVSINNGVTTARVTIPDDTELKITGTITLSAWIVEGSEVANFFIMSKDPNKEFELYHTNALNKWRWFRNGNVKENNFGWAEQRNTWYYVTIADDGTNSRVYINGAQIGSTDTALVGVSSTNDVNFLNRPGASGSIESSIDEARISNVARNGSWIKANYHSMKRTAGFLTWGAEQMIVDEPTTNFTASTITYANILLNWTIGLNSSHTYITRKTGSFPTSRTDGTNIYNDTGTGYSDSPLSAYTIYYYTAWGFNSTTGNWTGGVSATNHTGPLNPTNVGGDVNGNSINFSWTKGVRANNTLLVHNATAYPTSITDGNLLFNGTGLFYNDTTYCSGYYMIYSWNNATDLYSSGVIAPYGKLTINVYNESNPAQNVISWNIHIKDQDGSQTYTAYDNNNTHTLDINVLPIGLNMSIRVWADDYRQRLKTVDLLQNQVYSIDFYLPPLEILLDNQSTATPIYYIRVVETYETSSGIFERSVENAKVTFQKYINTTGNYENLSSLLTDANGYVNLYLIPSESYQVVITKPGYTTKISDYLPQPPNEYGQTIEKTFRINQTGVPEVPIDDITMDYLVLSAYNSTNMWIYYLNLYEDNNFVLFNVYDHIGSTLLTTYNISTNPDNISIYFNFTTYNILRVQSTAVRLNGTIYTNVKYFNADQARGRTNLAPLAAIFSIGICLFGLTIAHPKKVFGFVGIITMIIGIAITAFAEQVWYIHLIQAVEIILLVIIFLIFREEGVHAI